jgi:HAD superfamily hydrolase (TIGR01549 family)
MLDWGGVQMVVFDVDGTLYDQNRMRIQMIKEVLFDLLLKRNLTPLNVLRHYRHLREILGEEEVENFEAALVAITSERTGIREDAIRMIVSEWIEQRPLVHIRACRFPHIIELFSALKARGKIIGIFSDYPAIDKLIAMDLHADYVISATDREVGILKPHPRGLEVLMDRAGVRPGQTIFIGDRPDRDGIAARRASVLPLIRSTKPLVDWSVFSTYSDVVFSPLLASEANHT